MTSSTAAPAPGAPVLQIQGLAVRLVDGPDDRTDDSPAGAGPRHVVQDISFDIHAGETLCVVGESGSGKSVTSFAVMGLLAPDALRPCAGRILLDGEDILTCSPERLRELRATRMSMVFQEPMTALNPVRTVGWQIDEVLRAHSRLNAAERKKKILDMLQAVRLPDIERIYASYPHQLSGGQRQRIVICMALILDPKLLIADEPTSALDVTVQKQVLEVFDRLAQQTGVAVLFVTHNLAVACDHAHRAVVMRNGRVVESGPVEDLVFRPTQPYTRDLAASAFKVRAVGGRTGRPQPDAGKRAIEVTGLTKIFAQGSGQQFKAVDAVSFAVPAGSTFALVGESGSGKSTVARLILGLAHASAGTVRVDGRDATALTGDAQREVWRHIQLVQQNPQVALDPRLSVEQIIAEPLHAFGIGERAQRPHRVAELLDQVGLPRNIAQRRPRALSGGQQQRVAIARALAPRPRIVVLDEALSALDVVTQARIIDLLDRLQRELDLTYLFISHDLEVVRSLSDFVAVLRHGRLIESGPTGSVFEHPRSPYTRALLAATPGQRLRDQDSSASINTGDRRDRFGKQPQETFVSQRRHQ